MSVDETRLKREDVHMEGPAAEMLDAVIAAFKKSHAAREPIFLHCGQCDYLHVFFNSGAGEAALPAMLIPPEGWTRITRN